MHTFETLFITEIAKINIPKFDKIFHFGFFPFLTMILIFFQIIMQQKIIRLQNTMGISLTTHFTECIVIIDFQLQC